MRHSILLVSLPLMLAMLAALAACSGASPGTGGEDDASVDAPLGDAAPDSTPSSVPPQDGSSDSPYDGSTTATGPGDGSAEGSADGGPDANPTDGSAPEGAPPKDASPEGAPSEGGSECTLEGDAGVPVVPSSCMDLSGEYLENIDNFFLTRPDCGSLTWKSVYFGATTWTHLYTTDGVARCTTDEQGNPIVEEATVDATTMYVHRTSAAGEDIHQTVYWLTTPCDLLNPQGVYLTRSTTGTETLCELWSLIDDCPGGTAQCVADPSLKCQTNTTDDPNNCGGCGVACGTTNASGPFCVASRCTLACDAGFANCDGVNADGCNVSLASDPYNCGACGTACRILGTSAVACAKGSCAPTCMPGWEICDGNPANGCSTNVTTSALSCGSCTNDCVGGVCAGGACQEKGSVLATVASVGALAVDDVDLYYAVEDDVTGAGSISAIDKVKGGTPVAIAATPIFASSGDGTVYAITLSADATSGTLTAWTRATGLTQTVSTHAAFASMYADTKGVVWSSTALDASTTSWFTWAPGDSAPTTIYTGPSLVALLGIDSTYGFYLDGNAYAGDAATLMGVPRAGGSPVSFVPMAANSGWSYPLMMDDSYVYAWLSAGLERAPLVPSSGPPDAGAAFAPWASDLLSIGYLSQYGSDVFIAPDNTTQVMQVTKANTPVATAVAASGFTGSPFTVDASTVYVWEPTLQQIRRVPR